MTNSDTKQQRIDKKQCSISYFKRVRDDIKDCLEKNFLPEIYIETIDNVYNIDVALEDDDICDFANIFKDKISEKIEKLIQEKGLLENGE